MLFQKFSATESFFYSNDLQVNFATDFNLKYQSKLKNMFFQENSTSQFAQHKLVCFHQNELYLRAARWLV